LIFLQWKFSTFFCWNGGKIQDGRQSITGPLPNLRSQNGNFMKKSMKTQDFGSIWLKIKQFLKFVLKKFLNLRETETAVKSTTD
jgi:hypothetical protein